MKRRIFETEIKFFSKIWLTILCQWVSAWLGLWLGEEKGIFCFFTMLQSLCYISFAVMISTLLQVPSEKFVPPKILERI